MDLMLKDKIAIVTGGTRGIGRAIAEELVAEGCHVAICGRQQHQIDEMILSFKKRGASIIGTALDVGNGDVLMEWIKQTHAHFGQIDILIANASSLATGDSPEAFSSAFAVDLMHTRNAITACLPALAAQGHGSIVIISSISGVQDLGFDEVAYGAMKAALLFYMKSLSTQVGPMGIRVNAVSPGAIHIPGGYWSDIEKNDLNLFNATVKRTPMRRLGRAQDVAKAVAFLSSSAASYTTGTNLIVDGGFTRRIQN